MHPPAQPKTLRSVQMLRALAALAVAWFHIEPQFRHVLGSSVAQKLLTTGSVGVDVFFVISGFIIWTSTRDTTDPAGFVYRRLARIYTALWPAILIFAATIVLLGFSLPSAAAFSRSLTLLDLSPGAASHGLYVTWSLTYEVVFYLSFAALLWAGRRWAPFAALAVIAMVETGRWAESAGLADLPVLFTNHRWYEFLLGCVAGYLHQKGMPRRLQAASLLAGLLFIAFGIAEKGWSGETDFVVWFGGGTMLILLAIPLLEPWLDNPAGARLAHLGDWSYAIYLLHPTIILFMGGANAWAWLPAPLFLLVSFAVYTGLCLAASALYYTRVEQPLLRRSRRYQPGAHPRTTAEPA